MSNRLPPYNHDPAEFAEDLEARGLMFNPDDDPADIGIFTEDECATLRGIVDAWTIEELNEFQDAANALVMQQARAFKSRGEPMKPEHPEPVTGSLVIICTHYNAETGNVSRAEVRAEEEPRRGNNKPARFASRADNPVEDCHRFITGQNARLAAIIFQ